jgi:hypothetical protein
MQLWEPIPTNASRLEANAEAEQTAAKALSESFKKDVEALGCSRKTGATFPYHCLLK